MSWYLWFILGIVSGVILSASSVVGFAYMVMKRPSLQQKYMSKIFNLTMRRHRANVG